MLRYLSISVHPTLFLNTNPRQLGNIGQLLSESVPHQVRITHHSESQQIIAITSDQDQYSHISIWILILLCSYTAML